MADIDKIMGLAADAIEGGDPTRWFEELYAGAARGELEVPWADLAPHPRLMGWLDRLDEGQRRGRALDVGCGYGDNAAALAQCGFDVTAVDIAPSAVARASERFGGLRIDFRTTDVMNPPADLVETFSLVTEIYTLQALPTQPRLRLAAGICSLVEPGGRLLIVCIGRDADVEAGPNPPWPLTRAEIEALETHGMSVESFETFAPMPERVYPQFVVTLVKQGT